MLVGISGGRFLSHRHVALVSPCPNCHGWTVWSGFLHIDDMMQTGFSIAICGMSAVANLLKKDTADCCPPPIFLA
jgi:hypothetical protein